MELGGEFYLDLHTLSEKNHSVDAYLSGEQPSSPPFPATRCAFTD